MFTDEIIQKMKSIKCFNGVVPKDLLPLEYNLPTCFIVNLDNHDKPGSHWVAIYIDKHGIGEYFDPFGIPPLHNELYKYMFDHSPNGHFINYIPLQCVSCITCGEYCIAYLHARVKHNLSYASFMSAFTNNTTANDDLIKIYYSIIN